MSEFNLHTEACWFCFDESNVKQKDCPVCKGTGSVVSLTKIANFTKPLFGVYSKIKIEGTIYFVAQLSFMYTKENRNEDSIGFWVYNYDDELFFTLTKEEIRRQGYMLMDDYWEIEQAFADLLPVNDTTFEDYFYQV